MARRHPRVAIFTSRSIIAPLLKFSNPDGSYRRMRPQRVPLGKPEILDAYAAARSLPSRSAALRQAVQLLRGAEPGPAYDAAFMDWDESGEPAAWAQTAGDRLLADAPG